MTHYYFFALTLLLVFFYVVLFLQEIIDHETWIFNLTEANADSEKPPRWFKEYSFREAYDVKDLSPASMHDLFYNRWLNNNAEFNKVFIISIFLL